LGRTKPKPRWVELGRTKPKPRWVELGRTKPKPRRLELSWAEQTHCRVTFSASPMGGLVTQTN
jgi:hypothetical protein